MIGFVLKAVGALAVVYMAFAIGVAAGLDLVRKEAPEQYAAWAKIHDERRGKRV